EAPEAAAETPSAAAEAEAPAAPEVEAPAETPAPAAPAAAPAPRAEAEPPRQVGYTGEIEGRVVKLEDLLRDGDSELVKTDYDQLMRLVDESFTNVTEQQIVRGTVVSIGEKDVVIDIGFKSDGVVPRNEFDEEINPGDEVEVFLERLEDRNGQLVLSKTKADQVRRWQRIEDAYNNEEVLEGTIVRRIKGGMIVELLGGMEAFLPGSQIDVRPVRDF